MDTFVTVLRYKIWFDIWGTKQRSLQAILTIAIGAFAVGVIFGGWQGILADINRGWLASNPPTINLKVAPSAPQALLDALGRIDGVDAIEGQMEATIQWRPRPDAPWEPAILVARDDYAALELNVLRLEEGKWPQARVFGVERNFDIALGDQVELRINRGGELSSHDAEIGGVVYNIAVLPKFVGGNASFYTTHKHFVDLMGSDTFQKVTASVSDYSEARAIAVAYALEQHLEDQGYAVSPAGSGPKPEKISPPDKSPLADTIAGLGVILKSIGVIAVFLSLLLIYNTVTAIISQQTAQIGELKAIGADTSQILVVYFSVVFAYGLAAMVLAVPLGILAANGIRGRLISMLGADVGPFTVAVVPVLSQVALSLLAPVLIAAIPIIQGARITVREAMSNYGLSSEGSKLDEMLAGMPWLSRAMSLAVSNAFRNKQRVFLTQLALAGAGITFMAVMSARGSLAYSFFDIYTQIYRYPIQFTLLESASDRKIAQVEGSMDVTDIEVWQRQNVFMRVAGQPAAILDSFPVLIAVPLPLMSYQPQIVEGRWLEADDSYAVVLHEQLALNIGASVGDWITISIPDNKNQALWRSQKNWQVVGLLFDPSSLYMAMAPRTTVTQEIGGYGKGNQIQVASSLTQPDDLELLARNLRTFYDVQGIDITPSTIDTIGQRSAQFLTNITTISTLLVAMAVIVAAVGGISLSGVLSIGVLERQREIGVLRAIGSTPRTILTQFIAEGLMMGWLSWLIAFALSYPAGLLLTEVLAEQLQRALVFQFSIFGVALWFLLATLIGVFASWSPAQSALRMSVQESLAYE